MHRRKVGWTAATVFAIGVAFAAQPTSVRVDGTGDVRRLDTLWVPGTNMLMAAHESDGMLPPPR
jgi:hypothetical protein